METVNIVYIYVWPLKKLRQLFCSNRSACGVCVCVCVFFLLVFISFRVFLFLWSFWRWYGRVGHQVGLVFELKEGGWYLGGFYGGVLVKLLWVETGCCTRDEVKFRAV